MPRLLRSLLFTVLGLHAAAAADRPVSSPGILRLTHETAMQMALAKNFSIQVESFVPQIAKQEARSAWGEFDPAFVARYNLRENTLRDSFSNAGLRLQDSDIAQTTEWSVGFGGLTPWGLRYDLGLGNDSITGTFNEWRENVGSNLSVGLTQPLLRGFGTAANLNRVRVTRNNVAISEWGFRQEIIDVLTVTDFVYNELHSAKEELKVAERSLALAEQLVQDNEARLKIGVKSPLDVTEARATAAARVENVILRRQEVATNENLLKQLITNDVEPMLTVRVEITPPPSPVFVEDVPGGIRQALELRPDYRSAMLTLQNRQVILAFLGTETLPRLDLIGSLRLAGFDDDVATSLSRISRRDQSTWSVGAVMSIPIPNRTARANEEAGRLSVAQQLVALKQLEQAIVVQVDNASGEVRTARERIRSTDAARLLAQETLDAGGERLKAGVLTTFELLELQQKLADAEAAEIRAKSDYNKAVSEYYRRTGTTLMMYNVKAQ
jgi:outer membrane protein TolC